MHQKSRIGFRPHRISGAKCTGITALYCTILHIAQRPFPRIFKLLAASDVVGYQKTDLVANGQMKAAPFVTIGTNGVFLSDLVVTGDPISSNEGCWGDVSIAMLTGSGFNQKVDIGGGAKMYRTYFWYEEDGEYEAGWYDESENALKDDESVLGNADEIYFESGEAIWVNVRSGYAGCTLNFPAVSID